MRLLEHSGVLRPDQTGRISVPLVEERNGAVVGASDQDVGVLRAEDEGAEGRGRRNGLLGEVGVVQVPDVRLQK